MGYANRTIRLEFPDLSEDDDLIYVVIRNPKTLPADQITPADVPAGPDGTVDRDAAAEAMYEVLAGLVKDWHVYDATADGDVVLDLPATAGHFHKLPVEIVGRVLDEVHGAVAPPQ